jgi:two-component system, OmpR family, alkaline phosphatase synthesis response regulator PhoP
MSKIICLIEDNTSVNKLFTLILKKEGYEVVSFLDGTTFIEWANMNIASLIVMDIILPDINGVDLLKKMRSIENYTQIPVIAATAMASEANIKNLIHLGFTDVIFKPLNKTDFLQKIEDYLK